MRIHAVCGVLLLFCLQLQAEITFERQSSPADGNRILRADFNKDGIPDVVVFGGSTLSVLLNDGHGHFAPTQASTLAVSISNAVLLDFNKDGNTDFAGCVAGAGNSSSLGVWLGTGTGILYEVLNQTAHNCMAVASADFDGDNKPDIAVSWKKQNSDGTFSSGIDIYLGDGLGGVKAESFQTFQQQDDEFHDCHLEGGMAAGDIDQDGKADLVFGAFCPGGSRPGMFIFSPNFRAGSLGGFVHLGPFIWDHMEIAKVNLGKKLDVIARGHRGDGYTGTAIALWASGGCCSSDDGAIIAGGFGFPDPADTVNAAASLYLDKDGLKDTAVVGVSTSNQPFLQILTADTLGDQRIILDSQPTDVVSADFDRDGRPDVAVIREGMLEVFLNRASDFSSCPANSTLRTVTACIPDKVNGDVLTVQGNTTDGRQLIESQIYVDGVLKYKIPEDFLSYEVTLSEGKHRITVKAWDDLGAFSVTKNVTAIYAANCPNTHDRTVLICAPSNGGVYEVPPHRPAQLGTVFSAPVPFIASIADSGKIAGMKVYTEIGATNLAPAPRYDTYFGFSPGPHHLTIRTWDGKGFFSGTVNFTVVNTNVEDCGISFAQRPTVTMCSPQPGTSVGSPVHIVAGIDGFSGLSAVQIYVDGVVKFTGTSNKIDASLPMAAGTHRITVKAWDQFGPVSSTVNVTVQ